MANSSGGVQGGRHAPRHLRGLPPLTGQLQAVARPCAQSQWPRDTDGPGPATTTSLARDAEASLMAAALDGQGRGLATAAEQRTYRRFKNLLRTCVIESVMLGAFPKCRHC